MSLTLVCVMGFFSLLGLFDCVCLYLLMGIQKRLNAESQHLAERMAEVSDRLDRHKGTIPIRIVTERDGSVSIG